LWRGVKLAFGPRMQFLAKTIRSCRMRQIIILAVAVLVVGGYLAHYADQMVTAQ
jgi:hypothetical protein